MELLYILVGLTLGYFIFKPKKEEKLPSLAAEEPEEKELDPMTLRNDFGVYSGEKPTFAEQWVNIMNYNGKNQMEEKYE